MSLEKNTSSTNSKASAAPALVSRWDVDPSHATAQFGVRHMMISTVKGHFDKVAGHVELDEADPTRSKIEIQIDAASINSREAKRDAHLRSADFFDVENHPTITFKSTRIEAAGKDQYRVTGDLTIRGVTRSATLTVDGPTAPQKAPWGTIARGVSATGRVNRKDWGLNWNAVIEAGGFVVGDDVELHFEAELLPAK
ncbi:MAG TPA: YceI family protein [Polyangia bacterium]|nr:YceI family protein [Polyangia bacterium]